MNAMVARGLKGQNDPRITLDVLQLPVVTHVSADDCITVQPDPDDGDLRAAVRVDGAQMRERAGLDQVTKLGG
jgi:hypothetical protein